MSSPNPLPILLGLGSVLLALILVLVFVLWTFKLRKKVESGSSLETVFPLLGAGVVASLLYGFGSAAWNLMEVFKALDVVTADKRSELLAKFIPIAIKPAQYGFVISLVLVVITVVLAVNLPKPPPISEED